MTPVQTSTVADIADAAPAMPESTRIVEITPEQLQSHEVSAIYAIWQERRGSRPMPAREDMLPRPLGKLLRYISLTRFIPETGDYEVRIVGDAHVEAYGRNSPGERLSTVESVSPQFVAALKYSYDLVRARRAPVGYRGIMGRDVSQARFDWFETLYMPLGSGDDVQFILNASVYRPRDGKWPD